MSSLTLPPSVVDRALQDFKVPALWQPLTQPPSAPAGNRIEQLSGLEDTLDAFEQYTGISPLPPQPPPDDTGVRDMRVRAIRARLSELGYKVTRLDVGTLDDELRAAIRLFQSEAGITVDGWVGPETWDALQQLVALEVPLNVSRFYVGTAPYWALVRAVVFRLRALGVPIRPGMSDGDAFHYGLQYFKAVAYPLDLLSSAHPPTEPEVIARMFDHGRLVADLGASQGARLRGVIGAGLELDHIGHSQGSTYLQIFLARFVRTELWLAGYDPGKLLSELDGKPDTVQPFQRALVAFWKDVGLTPQQAEARKNKLDADLFAALAQQRQAAAVEPKELADFVAANADTINKAWNQAMSTNPIFFIWDGIQRGIRWLGQQIQKIITGVVNILEQGIDYVKMLLWNVVRSCYDPAAKVITIIRKACAAFAKGWGLYLGGGTTLREGNAITASWRLRVDGDLSVIATTGHSQQAIDYGRRFACVPRALAASSLILSDILDITVRLGEGPIGWVLLLSDLVRDAPKFVDRVTELAAADDFLGLA